MGIVAQAASFCLPKNATTCTGNKWTLQERTGGAANPFDGIDVGDDAKPFALDWDGDGDLDLLVGSKVGGLHYYEHLDNSNSVAPRTGPNDNPFYGIELRDDDSTPPFVIDWDRDGDFDLLMGRSDGRVSYFEGVRNAIVQNVNTQATDLGVNINGRARPFAVDWDSDGDLDLLVGGQATGLLYFQRQSVTSLVQLTGADDPFAGINVDHSAVPVAVDWDGDGLLDLLVGCNNGTIAYFQRITASVLSLRTGAADPFRDIKVHSYAHPTVVDWDRDGDLDLLVGDSSGKVHRFERLSDSSLAPRIDALSVVYLAFWVYGIEKGDSVAPVAVDWDLDGDLDLLVGLRDGKLAYFERLPDSSLARREGAAANPFHFIDVGEFASPAVLDWDKDGDLDLIVGNLDGQVSYYERLADLSLSLRIGPAADPFHGIAMGDYSSPFPVDWDRDGDLDLLIGHADGGLRYFERLPNTTLVLRTGETADPFHGISVGGYAEPCAVDWDGDGDLDLIVGNRDGKMTYFEQLPNSKLILRTGATNPFHDIKVSLYAVPFAVDWDKDGDLDLLVGHRDGGKVAYFERLADSSLAPADPFHRIPRGKYFHPCSVDWDGDGNPDMLFGRADGRLGYFERLQDSTLVLRTGAATRAFHGIGVSNQAVPIVADWDGDGDFDVLVGYEGGVSFFERLPDSTLAVALFERTGAPTDPFRDTHVGGTTYPFAADWDGNGNLDLLLGNTKDGTSEGRVSHMERLADSTLVWRDFRSLDVGYKAAPVAVDWDKDGDLDLLVGRPDGGIAYFERLPDYTLARRTGADADPFHNIRAGTIAAPVVVDWDKDGKLDLILGEANGTLRYFQRLPDPTFVPRTGAAANPFLGINIGSDSAPVAVDWDGDGSLELLVGRQDGTLSYFKRLTGSTFAEQWPFQGLQVGTFIAPVVVDWDRDGDLDLVVGNKQGRVILFERRGSNLSAANPFWPIDMSSSIISATVDWDGDGKLDLLVGRPDGGVSFYQRVSGDIVELRSGKAAGSLDNVKVSAFAAPFSVDWDGDGNLDLLIGRPDGGVSYYQRLSDSSLMLRTGAADPFHGLNVGAFAAPFAVDWDGDGLLDLLLGNEDGKVIYYKRRSINTLERAAPAEDPFQNIDVDSYSVLAVVDWDKDGYLDLLVGGADGRVKYYGRRPDSSLTLRTGAADPFHGLNVSRYAAPLVVDWNHDGTLDLLLGGEFDGKGRVGYYKGLPDGTVLPADPFDGLEVAGAEYAHPAVGDWDGDGNLELFVGYSDGKVRQFVRNPSAPSFLKPRPVDTRGAGRGERAAPFVADFDGDGDLDLLVGGKDGKLSYFQRQASALVDITGTAADPFRDIDVGDTSKPFALDYDGDGDLDLIVGGSDGRVRYFERGACSPAVQCSLKGACDEILGHCNCLVGYADLACSVCEAGFKRGAGEKECTQCQEGRSSGQASSACTQCELNHFASAGSKMCSVCPVGTKASARQNECEPCVGRTYSVNGTCEDCPAGSIPAESHGYCNQCPGGFVPAGDGRSCVPCGAGTAALSGASACTDCGTGTYSQAASEVCSACAKGKYAAARSVTCLLCSNGRIPANDAGSCVPCGPGTYATGGTCSPCQPGHFAAAESFACTPCEFGHVPVGDGSSCRLNDVIVVVCSVFATIALGLVVGWVSWRYLRLKTRSAIASAIRKRDAKKLSKAIARGSTLRVSKEILTDAESTLEMFRNKYLDTRFLLEVVAEGDLKLIKGTWLAAQKEGFRFLRQQDLPEEAVWNAEDLRAEQRCVLLVAISYCWLHPVHPDPQSKHFRTLRHALRLRLKVEGPGAVEDIALFLDYSSIAQHGESGDPANPVPGLPRTAEEQASFGRGLKQVNLAYANQLIEVWMMKWVPEEEERKYMLRGWPYFEQAISGLITDSTKLLSVEPDSQRFTDWAELFANCVAGRSPPMTPDRFEKEIQSRTFTNGHTDRDFVVHKYKETFDEVVVKATMLWFTNLDWTDEDAKELVHMLPYCKSVQQLFLGSNDITTEGASALVAAAKDCRNLRGIDLSRNHIDTDGQERVLRQWETSGKLRNMLRLVAAGRQSWAGSQALADAPLGSPEVSQAI